MHITSQCNTKIPLSMLELAVVRQGDDVQKAIDNAVAATQHVEQLGYQRVWLAEHHNMEHIASSATSVLIGHIAGKTAGKIRLGSGGIMLPNHSPLVIAEQFGTLASIYPGRIDLGLGRAPGTDQLTAQALRRNAGFEMYDFKSEILQLQRFLSSANSNAKVRAFPGEGTEVPIWVLGSSTDSAYLAAELGLPYAFASHFAPGHFRTAIKIYREYFKPSPYLGKPYMMACVNVLAADTDEEAEWHSSSLFRMFLGIVTNDRLPLQPPGPLPDIIQHPEVQHMLQKMLSCTFIGSKETLHKQLSIFIAETQIDELMVTSYFYDQEARHRSLSYVHEVMSAI